MSDLQRISAEKFWEFFSNILRTRFTGEEKWKAVAAYQTDSLWTEYLANCLEEVCIKLGMKSDREHWPRIDMKFFDRDDVNEWGSWATEAAIEYENLSFPAWHDEACKLMQITAGIKVIITYYKSNEEYVDLQKYLIEFSKVYKSRKYYQENDSWLFIFGPTADIWDKYDFKSFKFNGKMIVDITDERKIFQ